MRLSVLSLAISTLPLLSLASQATFHAPSVYLHPTPPKTDGSTHSPPTLSTNQAKAVLAHHLGHSADFSLVEVVGDWTKLMFGAVGLASAHDERDGKPKVLVIQGVQDPLG